ncbi:MAG: hypothetical protein ACJZ85_00410 [Pontiellaceae bacterium]
MSKIEVDKESRRNTHLSMYDTVILVPKKSIGVDIYNQFSETKFSCNVAFDPKNPEDQGREYKLKFNLKQEVIHISTLHSFKGWESSTVIIVLHDKSYLKEEHLYVALTRICRSSFGSYIHIVSSGNKFEAHRLLLDKNKLLD